MLKIAAVTAVGLGLVGAPVLAATYDASAMAGLKLTAVELGGAATTAFDIVEASETDGDFEEEGTGIASFMGFSSGSLLDAEGIGGSASAKGSADFPGGFAASASEIYMDISLTNLALAGEMTFFFTLSYALLSEVVSTSPFDAAGATAIVDIYSVDDTGVIDIHFDDVFSEAFFDGGSSSDIIVDMYDFTVTVDAGETFDMFFELGAEGGALAIPPVPLPATAPLVLAALGGLGYLGRRRQKAA